MGKTLKEVIYIHNARKTNQATPKFTIINSSDSEGDSVHMYHLPAVKSGLVIDLDTDTTSLSTTNCLHCAGVSLEVPINSDPYLAYPLGLHTIKPIPWKPTSFEDTAMKIRPHDCTGMEQDDTSCG